MQLIDSLSCFPFRVFVSRQFIVTCHICFRTPRVHPSDGIYSDFKYLFSCYRQATLLIRRTFNQSKNFMKSWRVLLNLQIHSTAYSSSHFIGTPRTDPALRYAIHYPNSPRSHLRIKQETVSQYASRQPQLCNPVRIPTFPPQHQPNLLIPKSQAFTPNLYVSRRGFE